MEGLNANYNYIGESQKADKIDNYGYFDNISARIS